ncbi:MAG: hypothetical protein WAM30_18310 [Candidatus Dormiibacterota bacterium]
MGRSPSRGQASERRSPAVAAQGRQLTVLILYSDTGGGHRAAARAIAESIEARVAGADVQLSDPLIGQGPPVVRHVAGLYPSLIRRARRAWGPIYHSSNTRPAWAMLRTTFGGQVRVRITRTLRRLEPDLVISVHPLLNHVSIDAIGVASRRRPPFVTVVTDLINLHRGWACTRADLVIVPTEPARQSMLRRGVRS